MCDVNAPLSSSSCNHGTHFCTHALWALDEYFGMEKAAWHPHARWFLACLFLSCSESCSEGVHGIFLEIEILCFVKLKNDNKEVLQACESCGCVWFLCNHINEHTREREVNSPAERRESRREFSPCLMSLRVTTRVNA
jgi:hypothetical protein